MVSLPQDHHLDVAVHLLCHLQGLTQEEVEELLRVQNLHGSNFKVELVMRLLGLAHARDTLIGNNMVRRTGSLP